MCVVLCRVGVMCMRFIVCVMCDVGVCVVRLFWMGDCLVVLSLFMVMRRCGELGVLCVCCCVLGMFGVVVLYYFCYIGE